MSEEPPPQYTNYPRASHQTSPFGRPPGVHIESLTDAWTLVRNDLATWIPSAMIMLIASIFIYGIAIVVQTFLFKGGDFFYQEKDVPEMIAYQLKSMIISLPAGALVNMLWVGMMNMGARQASGAVISIGDLFHPFRRFGAVFVTSMLVQVATTIGVLLLIVPGIYLTGAFSLATLIALNQDVTPIEAMKRSAQTLGSGAWLMFVVFLLIFILVIAGGCLCGVGVLFAMPIAAAWLGLHYFYFFPPVAPAYAPIVENPSA